MRPFFRHLGWAALWTCACAPDLSDANRAATPRPTSSTAPPPGSDIEVALEPGGALDAAPRVVRLHLRAGDGRALDPETFHVVRGEVGDGPFPAPLPKTLASREVAVQTWQAGAWWIAAPTAALDLGGTYSILADGARVGGLQVAAADDVPLLPLVWPPDGKSPTGLLAVWCGPEEIAATAAPALLDPAGIAGVVRSGIGPGDPSRRCLHFEPAAGPGPWKGPLVPPAAVLDGGGMPVARLEPRPLDRDPELPAVGSLGCAPGQIAFARGCARVLDDRLLLDTPPARLLWSITAPGPVGLAQIAASEGESFYVWPLPPSSALSLTVTTVDAAGASQTGVVALATLPAMAHLVINEVLADPIGPEPEQEWVEIYNDGLAPAKLGGLRVADVGGDAPLPPAVLPPGGFALLVNDGYDAGGKYDPAPAQGCAIVRLPRLGKDGLNNEGEPIDLLDAGGAIVSHFPAIKPKPGRSAVRTDPKSLAGFALSDAKASTPCAKNAAKKPAP